MNEDIQLKVFHIKINDGIEQTIHTPLCVYATVASEALKKLTYEATDNDENKVEVWCPECLPKTGPFIYKFSK